ncbi:hypothetical protein JY651_12895 [Pyxidicoccus parkwayensis]|uniref:S1 motif domain-containing protein n=1 Tax=Pyxidicoccus parkwayensis TaxID=2813578 RepID=A0ABX7P5M2_9BACT|nr:hypothetical protein [Pyxidicoccus parkwaysis]QSQ25769.1 hypothetical protein JY651_12895 [Pyxidicoccus parkwaysis]
MNVFECGSLTMAMIGSGVGMGVGYRVAGPLGVPVGTVLGFVAGSFIGVAVLAGVFGVCIVVERLYKHLGLFPRFGRYTSRRHDAAWTKVKEQLVAGKPVRGKVVLARYYGRFIDLGVGFPALLPHVDDGHLLEKPRPELHTEAEALVLEFDDKEREIVLTRQDRWWLARDGVTVGYLLGKPPVRENGRAAWNPITCLAEVAFREQLERGEAVPCQLLPPSEGARQVLVEKVERSVLRIRDITGT